MKRSSFQKKIQQIAFTTNLTQVRATFASRLQRILNVTTVTESDFLTIIGCWVNYTSYSNASETSMITGGSSEEQLKWRYSSLFLRVHRYPNALFYVVSTLFLTSYDNLSCVTVQCQVTIVVQI